jgi:hypothetical protein
MEIFFVFFCDVITNASATFTVNRRFLHEKHSDCFSIYIADSWTKRNHEHEEALVRKMSAKAHCIVLSRGWFMRYYHVEGLAEKC